MDEERDHDYDRVNDDGGGMNGDLVLWMDGRGEVQKRGGNHALDGEVLVFGRISHLAHQEPFLLGHHVPDRLSWQHIEVDLEAWVSAPSLQLSVEFSVVRCS
ncbi:unnamed protein product [Fusarium graminearum]|nr:unnamed protein product [Fusarium graminearum]CAG1993512.1 unnamed protein product [Fusarium graminearum]VTO87114.1 unnamed protein product [Fusarium graminearum]